MGRSPLTAPPSGLLPRRAVPAERDHLLDPARAVRVADRRRQQPGRELDPLRVRVRRPGVRVLGALRRRELLAGGVERLPDRGRGSAPGRRRRRSGRERVA